MLTMAPRPSTAVQSHDLTIYGDRGENEEFQFGNLNADFDIGNGYDTDFDFDGFLHRTDTSANQSQPQETMGPPPKRPAQHSFRCPVFEIENEEDVPHTTCSGANEKTMADLRRHLQRYHFYIDFCPTCKKHFFDEHEFNTRHGRRGQNKCNTHQALARGKALYVLYDSLWKIVKQMHPLVRNLRQCTNSTV
jgi:hypothetical protein